MRKFVVFVLCAALSCGFVGCGGNQPGSTQSGSAQTDTNTAENVTVNADTVFEALSKEGELVLDTKHDSVESYNAAKVPNVEMIVFRMPQETRAGAQERACYIEIYQTEDDLERSVEQYTDNLLWLYSSANVLLRMDGNVSSESAQKYADTLKNVTGKDVRLRNSSDPEAQASEREKNFQLPEGLDVNTVYEKLKEDLDGLEFSIYNYNDHTESERIIFWDKSGGQWVSGTITAHASNEDATSAAKVQYELNQKANVEETLLLSGNILLNIEGGMDEVYDRYGSSLILITGQVLSNDYLD